MHLPVTALDTLLIDGRRILAVGQGPFIRLYDSVTSHRLVTSRVFEAQPVHQISHNPLVGDGCLIVTGGRHVAVLSVRQYARGDGVTTSIVSKHSLPTKEWVLKTSHREDSFLLLTTNNNLYQMGINSQADQQQQRQSELLVKGPGSFLYSGDVKSIAANKILVAAGSVFGEVLVWECRRQEGDLLSAEWVALTTHRFEGHTGSVFGVSISEIFSWHGGRLARFVASCSDDRTTQVWDISEPLLDTAVSDTEVRMIDTGFGGKTQSDSCRVASGWGHQSRIWDTKFVDEDEQADREQLKLLTRGEDGTCQLWLSDLQTKETTNPVSLSSIFSDRHHSGKNVWSWTHYSADNEYVVFTGGADGRVVSRQLPTTGADTDEVFHYSCQFKELPLDRTAQSLKEYVIVEDGSMVALTNSGHIVRCGMRSDNSMLWEILLDSTTVRATKLCTNLPPEMLIAACTKSILFRWHGRGEHLVDLSGHFGQPVARLQIAGRRLHKAMDRVELWTVVTSMSGEACIIQFDQNGSTLCHETGRLHLPEHFIVTSACYDYEGGILVLGSRAGALALYAQTSIASLESSQPFCVRHIHGTESVTSLQFLKRDHDSGVYHVLSTGRNGKYAIHRLFRNGKAAEWSITTVHSACPPFGPYIEGASLRDTSTGPQLILYGFRSKDFVVWNETLQLDVFSVDCGGAHRSWAFRCPDNAEVDGGTFVWTKASTLNVHIQKAVTHKVVQAGGHGREIKALASCPIRYTHASRELQNVPVIATGAEDTTIRIFAITTDEDGSQIVQLCVLNEHTAGLQDLAFSPCGRYLFSCGGSEELFVWRVTYDVPVIGIGVTLVDRLPHSDGDSDIRIMGLSVTTTDDPGMSDRFRIAAAYSNGKVKLLQYDAALARSADAWFLDQDLIFGTFCLMQVADITVQSTSTHSSAPRLVLSAGTNGYLNTTLAPRSNSAEPVVVTVHPIHQSSILAMDVLRLSPSQLLVATGGDDNALGLTVITQSHRSISDGAAEQQFVTVRVSDAHAAALTSLKILHSQPAEDGGCTVVVATAGNDQRVQVWQLVVPSHVTQSAQLQVTRNRSRWTDVADVSCVEVVDSTSLGVTGVGIQVLPLEFEMS